MRIVYLVPGPISKGALGTAELSRRAGILQRWAPAGAEINVQEVPEGPGSIESEYEEFLALPSTARRVADLEQQDVDAVTGVLRGPGHGCAARADLAAGDCRPGAPPRSTWLPCSARASGSSRSPMALLRPLRDLAASTGLAGRLAGIAVVDASVLELGDNPAATAARAAEAAIKLVDGRGADTIVLGCMSMAFLDLGPAIEAKIGVPVVNPVQAALMIAHGRASFGVRHSKVLSLPDAQEDGWRSKPGGPVRSLAASGATHEEKHVSDAGAYRR